MKKVICALLLLSGMAAINPLQAQQFWIVGGEHASEGQFPWIGDQRISGFHQCGSSLISPSWVITAAHCVIDFSTGLPLDTAGMKFRFNTIITSGPINPSGGVEVSAAKIFIHPSFSINTEVFFSNGNDIALVKLKQPVTSITPVSLPESADTNTVYTTGHPVKIAGWGISDTATFQTSDTLKYCNTKVFNFSVCNALYDSVSRKSFCAGFMSGEEAAGAAAGDSGGPVWIESGSNKKITGLVSGGMNAFTGADRPGVYTKVAMFRQWIDSVMNKEDGVSSIDQPAWNAEDIRIGTGEQTIKIYFGAIPARNITCSIFNAEGRKVYEQGMASPANKNYTIDMNALAPGLYMIRFMEPGNGYFVSKKIVKNY